MRFEVPLLMELLEEHAGKFGSSPVTSHKDSTSLCRFLSFPAMDCNRLRTDLHILPCLFIFIGSFRLYLKHIEIILISVF